MTLFSFSPPSLGLHVGHRFLAMAHVDRSRGRVRLRSHRVVPLREGIIIPSAVEPNITDLPEVTKAIQQMVAGLGQIRHRVASVSLPDPTVRSTVLRLDQLPPDAQERERVIRWMIDKNSTVPVQDARIAFQPLRSASGHRLLVSAVHVPVLKQYEEAVSRSDLTPGIVDAASFHTFNLYREVIAQSSRDGGDFATLNVREEYYTIMIFADGEPDFIRVKAIHDVTPSEDPARDPLTFRILEDLAGSLTYYDERADGRRIPRLFLFGDAAGGILAKRIEEDLHLDVVPLDPGRLTNLDGLGKVRVEDLPAVIPALAAAVGRP